MKLRRRDLAFFVPALAAAQTFRNEDIRPVRNGALTSRQMLKARTHTGFALDLHESELPAGDAPHPPHHHVHEELLLIREGTLEVTIDGKSEKLGPGSTAYLQSNLEHGWRNVGTTTARYFVLALGDDQ
jgi:quercetin dioxygenase-like cupin family protein